MIVSYLGKNSKKQFFHWLLPLANFCTLLSDFFFANLPPPLLTESLQNLSGKNFIQKSEQWSFWTNYQG